MNYEKCNKHICDKILKEVQHGDITTLKDFKAKTPNFHWSQICYAKTGDTPLHVASRLSYLSVIDYLLQDFQPCAVDVKNNDDKTPLHEAAQFTQAESVLKLCDYGADVNALRRGDWTPLMLACTKLKPAVNLSIVQLLVDKWAEVNIKNKDGWTCAHILAREGGTEIFEYLVRKGLQANITTKNGRSALHIASLHGNKEFITKALAFININSKDNCGNTPLHEAILGQNLDIVEYLIQQGADINQTNNVGMSILHLAACQENIEILNYVLKELKLNINSQTKQGWTPAHCAARKGLKSNIKFLDKCGADLTIKDSFNRTANDYL